ncbi:hypothetical protein F5Y06DRAFT_291512 [Hypoxylon sp. FL0890]|nr:hypothetical protein F5Y06DRAFT_291512 [Hypoxylon sp. FL0890]
MTAPKIRLATASPATQATTRETLIQLQDVASRAAANSADILLLPEAYLGGYPRGSDFGCKIGSRTAEGREDYLRYFKSAIDLGDTVGDGAGAGEAWVKRQLAADTVVTGDGQAHASRGDGTREEIERIARETGVFIVVGLVEKAGGSLYCAVVYVDPKLGVIGKRRKVQPRRTDLSNRSSRLWLKITTSMLRKSPSQCDGPRDFLLTVCRTGMYKKRIKAWGFEKKLKEDEVLEILRRKSERDTAGKTSKFFIRGRNVDFEKVQRYVENKPGLLFKLEGPNEGTSSGAVVCRTPSPSPVMPIALPSPPDVRKLEEIMTVLRDYTGACATGSQPRWVLTPDGYATRSSALSGLDDSRSSMIGAWDELASLHLSMERTSSPAEMFQVLDSSLNKLKDAMKDELPEFVIMMVYLLRFTWPGHPLLLRMFRKHVAELSSLVLGIKHPLTIIWKDAINLEAGFDEIVEGILRALFEELTTYLGPEDDVVELARRAWRFAPNSLKGMVEVMRLYQDWLISHPHWPNSMLRSFLVQVRLMIANLNEITPRDQLIEAHATIQTILDAQGTAGQFPITPEEACSLANSGGSISWRLGDLVEAKRGFSTAVQIARHDHLSPRIEIICLQNLKMVYKTMGKRAELTGIIKELQALESRTGTERLIWAQGSPATLKAVSTIIRGVRINLAAAICWENYMPLLRQSLYAQNVNLYLAPTADGRDAWLSLMRTVALEGRCFVVSSNMCVRGVPSGAPVATHKHEAVTNGGHEEDRHRGAVGRRNSCLTEEGFEIALPASPTSSSVFGRPRIGSKGGSSRGRRRSVFDEDGNEIALPEGDHMSSSAVIEEEEAEIQTKGKGDTPALVKAPAGSSSFISRGGSSIVSPFGDVLAGPQWEDDEGIIYADVDFEDCIRGRLDLDAAGSYSRNDSFKFSVAGLDLDPLPYY